MSARAISAPTQRTERSDVAEVERVSHDLIRSNAANELVFAVVGHVGSGTSEIAQMLNQLLQNQQLPGGGFDVVILKARDEILQWARDQGQELPDGVPSTLAYTKRLQDLGDLMRYKTRDHAAVARALVQAIRRTRAQKQKSSLSEGAVVPDGTRRAYILDSIRHPGEVHVLRQIYQSAFALIGVVCDEEKRVNRIVAKYSDAGKASAEDFMSRDAHAEIKHGQRVSDAFHLSDYFIDNTADRFLADNVPNPSWDIPDQLSRLIKVITHSQIVRPTIAETAMYAAYGAAMRSACLSRQVGAALVDRTGNIIATGTNEVPRANGGVYGESTDSTGTNDNDHRCAYRPLQTGILPFCSNTVEQNRIIEDAISRVPELSSVPDRIRIARELRGTRIGELLEFSRAVHAEMDALLSAGRSGASSIGTRLFVTTFPCHYCARHIVTAGVDEVQYIEPYPKSRALKLHSDSITIDRSNWKAPSDGGQHVLFRPFTGIAPRLYARAFMKDRELKDGLSGKLLLGEPDSGSPWYLSKKSYAQLEAELAKPAEATVEQPTK